jgi:2-polyprenyl-3-methyl-5-hydroxy-6-metoxy-1,4-benzoquinol methylase
MSQQDKPRGCWCGHPTLEAYSQDYHVCKACGTLVSRAPLVAGLYEKEYWTRRQTEHHGLPDIAARARLDLPERCTHWLRRLLQFRLPPARVLEVGCGHGGFVALLGWAGFQARGTEMNAWVADFAAKTFGVTVNPGPVEAQHFPAESFDVVVLNDVIEHLPRPEETLRACARLLAPGGFFLIQTPEYVEHRSYDDLRKTNDLFLKHMDRNNEEHLYLFSRRSAAALFGRLGFPVLDFSEPVYAYDMAFTASRSRLVPIDPETAAQSLAALPTARLVQGLIDKARESADRWWAIKRLETQNRERQGGA